MSSPHIWETVSAIIVSIGGGGLIVAALSSWLGKVWADRLMARETAAHNRDLAAITAKFDRELETLRDDLFSKTDRLSHGYRQKIELYKEVGRPLIAYIAAQQFPGDNSHKALEVFDEARLNSTALLGLFAPTEVFDSYNNLMDYIFDCNDGTISWDFGEFRNRALTMLSLMRKDVGMFNDSVSYKGHR